MGRPILAHKMINKAGITPASQHNAHTVPHFIDAVRCYLSLIGMKMGKDGERHVQRRLGRSDIL